MDLRSTNPAGRYVHLQSFWPECILTRYRKGEQSDMAATILFLAGKGGVFYNEQILYPDGGKYAFEHNVSLLMI